MLCLVTQLCQTLCDPMDCSFPGFSVHGDSSGRNTGVGYHALLQRIFPTQESNPGLPHCRLILYHLNHQGSPSFDYIHFVSKVMSLSRVRLLATPWTVAYQAPPSMGFSSQEYWSGLPCPPPGDLTNPGMDPRSPTLQADSLPSEPPGEPFMELYTIS